ncbi:MAG: von Willebrand factor, type [Acidobacteriales bacterium]|nr:von Willebrand factor, type [Terriglobales bacterium]
MNVLMRNVRILVLAGAAMMMSSAMAQTTGSTGQELPSAPSATSAPAKKPAPPASAQTTPAPTPKTDAQATQPVLQSLGDGKKKPTSTPAQDPQTNKGNQDPSSALPPPDADNPASDKPLGAKDSANPDDFTVKKKVEEVNVIFTVTDKHGRFIKNLQKDEFSVMDDKRPAEAIRSFVAETNLPLRVGLLVDASNSIRDRFKFEQEAAIEFLNQIIRPVDEGFVLGFDTTPEVTQDFTSRTEKLSAGVRMLRPGGGTALFDALYYACRDKLLAHPDKQTVRKAIILLSDGDDNQSRVTREEAIEMAQRAEVVVYTISTNLADKGRGDKVLERISEATGGRAFFPFKIQDVSNAFLEIQEELRSQYALAYKPADFNSDGRYRSIDITAHNNKLKVRARKGYFAPKG